MRTIAILLTVVMLIGLLACCAGCTSKSGDSEDPDAMSAKELRNRGPQPPQGKQKTEGGQPDAKAGQPKAGG